MNNKNAFLNILVVFSIIMSLIGFALNPGGNVEAASGLDEQAKPDIILQANLLEGEVTLSGNVYQEDGLTPIASAQVEAIHSDSGNVEYASTDTLGYYEFLIAPGDYYVSVTASGYATEYFDNTFDSSYATMVSVEPVTGTSGIDFDLSPEAVVTGYVYDSDGETPIVGAGIYLYQAWGVDIFETASGEDGSYSFTGLSSGTYVAYADADGYDGEYYLDQLSWGSATEITVTQPYITSGINFSLANPFSLSGHVYQADGVTPIKGAIVYVLDDGFNSVDIQYSDDTGFYEALLAPGQYYVSFEAYGYGSVYYQYGYDYPGATLVTVEVGTGASGINISLSPEATISGNVYESDGVTPITYACVEAYPENGGEVHQTWTDTDGSYTLYGFASGNYLIHVFGADGYEEATYPTPVTVTQPDQTAGINFSLNEAPVTLSGYIYQEDGVTVIPDSGVLVMNENFDVVAGPVDSVNGYYALSLLPGNYYLFATAEGYGAEYYPNGYNEPGAELVSVQAGVGAEGINFTLSPEATISGYVFQEDGITPISGAQVVVVANDFDSVVTYPAITASDGSYTARSLATGDYTALAIADGYIDNFYTTVIHVTQPNATTGINFSLTAESTEVHITGHVYQEDTTTPINEAWVTLYDQNFDSVAAMATDSNGLYDFQVLPGQYYLQASASGYGDLFYQNSYDREGAVPITAEAGTGAGGIDFSLYPEAKISGFVYESDGVTPISSADVCISAVSNELYDECYESGEDGSYTILNLSSGSYIVYAIADGYFLEFYLETNSSPTEIQVTQPNETTGINFTLDKGVILSGHIFQDDGVTPINEAWIRIYNQELDSFEDTYSDINGLYEFQVLPGQYYVEVSAIGYGSLYYPNSYDREGAVPITAEAGTGASGIDFTLSPEAKISGFVYESDGVTPISSADVCISAVSNELYDECYESGEDGSYTINGLSSGSYIIQSYADGYLTEYYLEATTKYAATEVTVTQPNETTGINFTLDRGAILSGHVYQADGVTPLEGAGVSAFDDSDYGFSWSDSEGYYEILLMPGLYYVNASADGYGGVYYPNSNSKTGSTQITVEAGTGASGIDFSLSPEATISGFVFESDGVTPISEAHIGVVLPPGGVPFTRTTSGPDGSYIIHGLASGTYWVVAQKVGYSMESSKIQAIQPNAITGLNFSLTAESSEVHLTGHVYQEDGSTPLNEAWVTIYDQDFNFITDKYSDSNGFYDFQLLPGQYYVEVSAIGYGSLYYPNSYDRTGAVPIMAEAETGASGIDLTLSPEAKISGFVYESDGITPISSANICIKAPSDHISYCYESGEDGSYTINGLSSGSYIIQSYADGYLTEYYLEATTKYAATEVTVTQPNETTGINFTLDRGAILSGHVYQADGVTPLEGAGVSAFDDSDYGFSWSDSEGYYEILLTPGLYYVEAFADGFGGVYYPNSYSVAGAVQISVEAGTGASGIDFSLSPEATISGYVYESDGVTPISEANIIVYPTTGKPPVGTTSGPDGSYTIYGLASGSYYARAEKSGYIQEIYLNGTRTAIQVTQPNAITGLNFSLDKAYRISGHVYEEDGTTPISGANIMVRDSSNKFKGSGFMTDANGYYEAYIGEGDYYVIVYETAGYGGEYYPDSCGIADATLVTVTAPDGVSGIDFQLAPDAKISGYVYESDGITPIAGARVAIEPVSGGIILGGSTNIEGMYQFGGLCSGDYILYSSVGGVDGEWYQDKSTIEEATPVTLTQPFETTDINFILGEQSYSISGSITLPDGVTPLAGVTIRYDSTHSVTTDGAGEFLLADVPPGTYTLTPSLAGYVFDPATISVDVIDSDSTGNLFTAYAIPGAFAKTSPAAAAVNQQLEVTLSWGASTGAEYYEYCIDKTNDNACSDWIDVGVETSALVTGLDYQTRYYWQVRAWNGIAGPVYANGSATAYRYFNTKKLLVTEAPVNVSATDGTYPDKVEVTWDAVFAATSYKIYRAATPTGTQTLLGSTTALLYNNVPAAGIKYYYFVQGCNANGCGPKSFYDLGWRTAATITARSVLTLPANGAFLADREVSFGWEFVPGATGYELQVDTNTYFAAPLTMT